VHYRQGRAARHEFHLVRGCLVPLFALLCYLAAVPLSVAAAGCEPWVARLASAQGHVERRIAGREQWIAARLDELFCEGDSVRVRNNSRAALTLNNNTVVRLDQDTTVTFTGMQPDEPAWLDLVNGVAHFISRVRQSFKVVTPFVNAAVEGTEFVVAVGERETQITVFEGQVAAGNAQGELVLTTGQSAVAGASQAPALRTVVKPRAAVHWALYYPAILDFDAAAFAHLPGQWRKSVDESLRAYQAGDITGALNQIDPLPASQPELAPVYLFRASLRLSVGRATEAAGDLNAFSAVDNNRGPVLALQSIIAVAQNDPVRALELARRAVAADASDAAAALALSYAQQAQFAVEGALATLQSAVRHRPDNALLWARLAELYLSVAELDAALEAAQRATQLSPDLAQTRTVLGFAYLAQIKIRQAEEAFEQAIELNQAAPLPRLGLGLATIRRGELDKGRRQIELAASLDPSNSLIRSYLGKAYFDEKRDGIAATELSLAKQLDPHDPTPWFYDAIRKHTENRPIEALQDMQKSIELNNNRAVYRSKLLLDQDLAARSASLARIYTDLDFDQLALVEGWKSVSTDPGNFSAHRLLADSYATLPRHQIARVSELLQSQLLQPINLTPLQPELAEADLLLYEGLGPSDPSLLEFNPLFTRNRLALQGSGVIGGNDTFGNNLIQSGVHNNWSYSIGQYHYETDGFRDNNDQEQDIYNLFVQNAVSFKTSIQAEVRISDIDEGDLPLRFDPDDFSDTQRRDLDTGTYRLGLHHVFNPRSELVGSVIWTDRSEDFDDPGVGAEIHVDTDGYVAEIQHLWQYRWLRLTSGAGRFDGNEKERLKLDFGPPFGTEETREKYDLDHDNLYVYSQASIAQGLTLTAGVSYDDYSDNLVETDQWNPKVGVLWDITPATTLRAAAFRVVTRTVVSEQTIEPTQVAGFNQFYDDPEGSDSKRYGVALDHRFSKRLFSGVEYSKRNIEAPFLLLLPPPAPAEVDDADAKEKLARAYLYWTPSLSVALSAEYQYEDIDRDDDYPPDLVTGTPFTDLKTHRLPLGVTVHRPSGWFAGMKATYVDQEGTFLDPFFVPTDDDDQFWIVDAGLGYRLPKRRGFLSAGIKNLLDESFKFQDTNPVSPTFYPERLYFGRVTLSF
jgi:tetratricopeptide (TPR) repeat protein